MTAKEVIISKKSIVKKKILQRLEVVDNWNRNHLDDQVSKSKITYSGHEWAFGVGEIMRDHDPDITRYFDQNIASVQHSILDAGLILYFNGNSGSSFLQANGAPGKKPVWEIYDTGYGGTLCISKTMSTNIPIY